MTPQETLYKAIISRAKELAGQYTGDCSIFERREGELYEDVHDRIANDDDDMYDYIYDAKNDLSEGCCETDIEPAYSRHYESKSVAQQFGGGRWIGWTYWYGGGKHGEPWSVDWVSEAYDLDVKEEVVTQVVRTFTRKEGS